MFAQMLCCVRAVTDAGFGVAFADTLVWQARHVYDGENIGRLYTSIFVACSRDVRDNGTQGFEIGKSLLEEMRYDRHSYTICGSAVSGSACVDRGCQHTSIHTDEWVKALGACRRTVSVFSFPNAFGECREVGNRMLP